MTSPPLPNKKTTDFRIFQLKFVNFDRSFNNRRKEFCNESGMGVLDESS